jgi:hypothetical protein
MKIKILSVVACPYDSEGEGEKIFDFHNFIHLCVSCRFERPDSLPDG